MKSLAEDLERKPFLVVLDTALPNGRRATPCTPELLENTFLFSVLLPRTLDSLLPSLGPQRLCPSVRTGCSLLGDRP